jgi:RNA polymerase sigma factor (sigma-70 family)
MSSKHFKDDDALIKACIKGDEKAHKTLYDTYSPVMYAICLRYMKNENDAKDALQEGFIRAFKKLSSFKFKGSFEGWLKRLFVNISIELLRKRKHFSVIDDHAQDKNLSVSQPTGHLDASKLLDVVNRLPDGYRTVFNMYVVDGYSHREIAEELGVSESTSKTQLFKARKQLQAWLKDWKLD